MTKENMMNTTDERDHGIRALLVDNARRPEPRRRRTSALIAAIAFLLGGSLATGAVSAAVAATRAPVPVSVPENAFSQMLQGGHTLGKLVTYTGHNDARLDLGPRPAGATGIMWFLQCGNGRGQVLSTDVGGESDSGQTNCKEGSGVGSFTEHIPTNSIVSIKTDGKFTYTAQGQWYAAPAPVAPSAAQKAAISDGKVTSDELHASVDRFVACMVGAGYALTVTEYDPAPSFSDTSDSNDSEDISGAYRRCNDAELKQVAALWETDHK
jgi:hypothetical protein